MSKTIQIRNVPDRLHRKLKTRAAKMDVPLSAYLLSEFKHMAEVPTLAELEKRLRHLQPPSDTAD